MSLSECFGDPLSVVALAITTAATAPGSPGAVSMSSNAAFEPTVKTWSGESAEGGGAASESASIERFNKHCLAAMDKLT